MKEPWNIKDSDNRQADSLPTFIIFCEDEVSEPIYFQYFETSLIKVNVVKDQKSKIDNVIRAITHCISTDLIIHDGDSPRFSSDDTHVWCVFDRDSEETNEKERIGNTHFNESIKMAERSGIKVAWSNDSFELWILLHFEDVSIEDPKNKKRINYYDKLTSIFNALEDPNEDLIKVKRYAQFSYKLNLKQRNNFRNIVRNEIIPNTLKAIERAKKLEELHSQVAKPDHLKYPCTMVHHLIMELLAVGKKDI